MKEKMTIILTLLSLVGLTFHYNYKTNIINEKNNTIQIKPNNTNSIDEVNIEIEKEVNAYKNKELNITNKCKKNVDETDKMSFNNAFNYYYSCYEKGNIFKWNNQAFVLEIKQDKETNLTNTDSINNNQILVSR